MCAIIPISVYMLCLGRMDYPVLVYVYIMIVNLLRACLNHIVSNLVCGKGLCVDHNVLNLRGRALDKSHGKKRLGRTCNG